LINQKPVPAWEAFGQRGNLIRQVDGLLVDLKLLEHESHDAPSDLNRRKGEQAKRRLQILLLT